MNYLLIENEQLVGICDYEPNIGNDDIKILKYSGNIPKERILYLDGKVVDTKNFVFVNGKYIKNTKAVADILNKNKTARNYLTNTDWLVIRHRDQLDLNLKTSLNNNQYIDLLNKRQEARKQVIEYDW